MNLDLGGPRRSETQEQHNARTKRLVDSIKLKISSGLADETKPNIEDLASAAYFINVLHFHLTGSIPNYGSAETQAQASGGRSTDSPNPGPSQDIEQPVVRPRKRKKKSGSGDCGC